MFKRLLYSVLKIPDNIAIIGPTARLGLQNAYRTLKLLPARACFTHHNPVGIPLGKLLGHAFGGHR